MGWHWSSNACLRKKHSPHQNSGQLKRCVGMGQQRAPKPIENALPPQPGHDGHE